MKRTKRNHPAQLKAKMAASAIGGDETLVELTEQFDVNPNQISDWKQHVFYNASAVFDGSRKDKGTDLKEPYAKAVPGERKAITKAGRLSAKR